MLGPLESSHLVNASEAVSPSGAAVRATPLKSRLRGSRATLSGYSPACPASRRAQCPPARPQPFRGVPCPRARSLSPCWWLPRAERHPSLPRWTAEGENARRNGSEQGLRFEVRGVASARLVRESRYVWQPGSAPGCRARAAAAVQLLVRGAERSMTNSHRGRAAEAQITQ